jgi:hypothetical protein
MFNVVPSARKHNERLKGRTKLRRKRYRACKNWHVWKRGQIYFFFKPDLKIYSAKK